jgi:hypothetical protein
MNEQCHMHPNELQYVRELCVNYNVNSLERGTFVGLSTFIFMSLMYCTFHPSLPSHSYILSYITSYPPTSEEIHWLGGQCPAKVLARELLSIFLSHVGPKLG